MGAPSARTSEHARHWARLGHEVTVVTGFPNHPTGVIRPEYRGQRVRRERVDGVDVLRTWIYCAPNKGFFKRVLNFLSFFCSSFVLGVLLRRLGLPAERRQARAVRLRGARHLAAVGGRTRRAEEPAAHPRARSD
jgi:hypothetical protein